MAIPARSVRFDWFLVLMAAVVLGAAAFQILAGYTYAWGIDDAYISYRYAQHLAHGYGLVFNPGERVEGYSTLLYVLLMAPAFWIGDGIGIFLYSVVLNVALLVGALLLFVRIARRCLGPSAPAAVLLFVLCPPIWLWTSSGMETILVLVIQLALWDLAEELVEAPAPRGELRLALVALLSLAARADGFIAPLIVAGYLLLRGQRRPALRCALAVAGGMALYVLWRMAYYGYPLPNTYYVKVSGPLAERLRHSITLLGQIALDQGLLPYLLASLVLLVRSAARGLHHWPSLRRSLTFELVFIPLWLGYWLFIGGDNFLERFLLPLFPLGAVLLWRRLGPRLRWPQAAAVTLALALLQLRVLTLDPRFDYSGAGYDRWITLGRYIGAAYPGRTLAIDAAGKVPFFSQLATIDMLGLNDSHIGHMPTTFFYVGHNKFDPDYVLGRKPDLIAAWVWSSLDLTWGVTRDKYLAAGYRLEYLLAENTPPDGVALVRVSGLSPEAVQALRKRGYIYGVLVKDGLTPSRGAGRAPLPAQVARH